MADIYMCVRILRDKEVKAQFNSTQAGKEEHGPLPVHGVLL